jgi:uncharacterized protein
MPKEIIEIKEYKKLDLRESILIDGFPSVGLISTIISNYYISAFNLDGMAFIDSPYFPPLTLVYAKKPKYPARIHASEDKKLTVISCEFTPAPQLVRAIGEKIVKWAITRHIHSIITFVGILEKGSSEQVSEVYAVGSTEQIRNLLSEKNIPLLEHGAVIGLPAIILNECRWLNFDAVCFVVRVFHPYPEFRAAANVIEYINKIYPSIAVDTQPLYKEAENIEKRIREIREATRPVQEPAGTLYR